MTDKRQNRPILSFVGHWLYSNTKLSAQSLHQCLKAIPSHPITVIFNEQLLKFINI